MLFRGWKEGGGETFLYLTANVKTVNEEDTP